MRILRFALGLAFTLWAAGLVVILSWVRGPSRAWELMGHRWARSLMRICGVEIQVGGEVNLVGPAVFVANHQSFLDPMLLTAVLPVQTKWVAKAEFRRVPILGTAFGACAIYIDRRDPSAARAALSDALDALPPGWSVAVFPEGTRSPDGELQAFKKGVVHLATQLRLPVIPLGVVADSRTLPRAPGLIRPGVVRIEVGQAVSTQVWSADEAGLRAGEVQAAVAECVARAKSPPS
ncbi:MAG: 1-acyl-sn-glycerol-3-phosphate acyltransferase [Planctomycetes bacterium]|nr:1-acyl-sn-glycerol-3-phosphate acyltransferase [Planctomycetota bacterium]